MSLAREWQPYSDDSDGLMDQAKTLGLKTRRRISSLPNALTEMNNSFEKLGQSSCSPKLPKHLAANRRHSIHIPHSGSPVQDVTDQFKLVRIKPRSQSCDEEGKEGGPIRGADNERSTKHTHFPVLQGTQLTLEPSAGKKTHKTLQRFHSYDDEDERKGTIQRSFEAWTLLHTNGVTHASPLGLGAKSTVPENQSKLQDNRRHSLPVSTESLTDLFSMSFSTSKNFGKGGERCSKAEKTNLNALPQVTQAKLPNLHVNQPEKHRSDETEYQKMLPLTDMDYQCSSTNQTRSCAEGKDEKVQAMRTHLEKEEARFNKDEERAVRLFEWLKEQTDNDESR